MDNLEINTDSILITINGKEIVSWHEDEWQEDPTIIVSIANAINLYHTNKNELIKLLGY